MHQLTIDDSTSVAVSGHSSFQAAHRALLRYVIGADRYLHIVDDTAERTRYQLLRLADPDDPRPARVPRITGTATIEQLTDTAPSGTRADFAARDAREALPRHAISGQPPDGPAATVAAVARPLPADTSGQQSAALICHHRLPCWGANSP